jgi:hypothetical protein
VVENHLDKAVARLFYKKYSVGVIPMSDLYVSNPPDNLLRLAFNRCQKDIDFMLDAFRDFVATIDKEESTKSV